MNLANEKIDSPEGALHAMASIDAAMKRVNDMRSDGGALTNRMEFALSNNQNQLVNSTQALSNVEDLDYAQGLTEKVRNDILSNSQASAISQFNQLTRTHLLALLQ